MVGFHTLQEKIRTILYEYQFSGTLQFVGLRRCQYLLPDTFFLIYYHVIYWINCILIKVTIDIISNLTELF